MKLDDTLTGGAFAALGATLIALARSMEPLDHIPYGPGLFPTIVGGGMVLFGGVLVLEALRAQPRRGPPVEDDAHEEPPPQQGASPAVALAGFIAAPLIYVAAAPALGFLIVMPLIIGGLIGLLRGRWLSAFAIGIVVTIVLQILFQRLMLVPLPWGVLEPWSGVLS